MSFSEDLDEFLDTEQGFAVEALYQGNVVHGIFSSDYVAAAGEFADAESAQPRFICKASDMPDVAEGDLIEVNDASYAIGDPEPDGTGLLKLKLFKQ